MEEEKLSIKIENTRAISLQNLTIGLLGISDLYRRFTKDSQKSELLVKEVRKGSIELELLTLSATSILPIISDTNNIIQFVQYIKLIVAKLSSKNSEYENLKRNYNYLPDPDSGDLKAFGNSLDLLQHPRDRISISTVFNGNQFHQCSFAGPDAQIMRDNLIANQEETVQIFRKVIFKWEQTNHSSPKSGNRAIIPEVSPRPCRVIFSDDFLKKEMTTSREGTDWDKMFYFVDVSATKALGKVVSFKILEVYLDESFPIEETED